MGEVCQRHSVHLLTIVYRTHYNHIRERQVNQRTTFHLTTSTTLREKDVLVKTQIHSILPSISLQHDHCVGLVAMGSFSKKKKLKRKRIYFLIFLKS